MVIRFLYVRSTFHFCLYTKKPDIVWFFGSLFIYFSYHKEDFYLCCELSPP